MKPAPTTEERVWAVLAHLSALATGWGLPLPIIGWAEQRRKSNYASFHCLQALGYQSLGYTVWLLLGLLVSLLLIIGLFSIVASVAQGSRDVDSIISIGVTVTFSTIFLLLGVYFLLPIIAAVACVMGKDFRYPFMGTRLARYLEYGTENEGWLNEDHEDRWVTAMGHFSVIIALWGMLAPLTAWIMQGKRSLFLKVQSAQALTFHGVVLLISLAALVIYFVGFIVFAAMLGLGGADAADSSSGMVALGVLIISMLIAALIILIVPLFHIMGQWAGYRVLKGDDYMYPVLGKLVEKFLGQI